MATTRISFLACALCGLVGCAKPTAPPRNGVEAQTGIKAPSTPDREHVPEAAPADESPRRTFGKDLGPRSDDSSARDSLGEAKLKEVGGRDLGLFAIQKDAGDQLKTLAALDGEVRLVRHQAKGNGPGQPRKYPYRAESYPWKITRTAQGYTLQATGQGMKHSGWYLSLDREMPKGVFLAERPTAGSYWNIDELPAFSERDATPVRAGIAGADWQLDFDPDGETYLRDAAITEYVTVYQLTLVQGPGTRWKIDFFGK